MTPLRRLMPMRMATCCHATTRSTRVGTRYHNVNVITAEQGRGFGGSGNYKKTNGKSPSNCADERYLRLLSDDAATMVISTGPAGTGKTMLACGVGLEKLTEMFDKKYERLIITRPTIPVGGESLGYLPGTLDDKMSPWVEHLLEYIDQYKLKSVMNKVEMIPLSYIRGRTFENTWVIADEMQNSTPMQMKTLLTRMGENSKIVITGDMSQSDLPLETSEENGLSDLLNRIERSDMSMEDIHVEFTINDVRRSEFVKYIIELYMM